MKNQQVSETWEQLIGLDADQAASLGWFSESIESSPTLGLRMDLYNPKGQLVAWGWSPTWLNVVDMVRTAQAAYAAKVQS